MEYCEGGSLRSTIENAVQRSKLISLFYENNIFKDVKLNEQSIWNWFTQITMALEFIHEKGIIHRLVKPENILFNFNKERCKLGGFAFAKELDHGVTSTVSGLD